MVLQLDFFKNIKWTGWNLWDPKTELDLKQDRLGGGVLKPVSVHFFNSYTLRTIATLVYR